MYITNSLGLPNEVLLQICSYLDKESLIAFGQTSSLFRRTSGDPSLWKSFFLKPKTSEDVTCLNKRIEWFQNNETNYKKTYLEYLKIFCICSKNYTDINLEIHPNANLFRIKSIIETQLKR